MDQFLDHISIFLCMKICLTSVIFDMTIIWTYLFIFEGGCVVLVFWAGIVKFIFVFDIKCLKVALGQFDLQLRLIHLPVWFSDNVLHCFPKFTCCLWSLICGFTFKWIKVGASRVQIISTLLKQLLIFNILLLDLFLLVFLFLHKLVKHLQ